MKLTNKKIRITALAALCVFITSFTVAYQRESNQTIKQPQSENQIKNHITDSLTNVCTDGAKRAEILEQIGKCNDLNDSIKLKIDSIATAVAKQRNK